MFFRYQFEYLPYPGSLTTNFKDCRIYTPIKQANFELPQVSVSKRRYRKIPKISPEAYIFQRPFSRGLLLEGLIFGRASLRREICVYKSIGLALYFEVNLPFLLCFTLYLRAIFQVQAPGDYIWRGDLTEGFLHHQFEGLIFGGVYFRNFTVSTKPLI